MQGHWSRAFTAAQALVAFSSTLPQLIQGESSLHEGKLDEAEQLLHAALQAEPQNQVSGALLSATMHKAPARFEGVISTWSRCKKVQPARDGWQCHNSILR